MDNLLKCPNGHFYDGNEYRSCPYCQQNTVPGTLPVDVFGGAQGKNTLKIDPAEYEEPAVDDIDATVGAYNGIKSVSAISPVAGWLVCIEGSQKGRDFRLCAGRNYIGRGSDMDVCLAGDTRVSRRRHAIVIFDPVSQSTLCQAGESRELFYHNGKVVTDTAVLGQGDILQIGNTKLIFVPFCGAIHTWEE